MTAGPKLSPVLARVYGVCCIRRPRTPLLSALCHGIRALACDAHAKYEKEQRRPLRRDSLEIVGVLLAAGRGSRFGAGPPGSKLLVPWSTAGGPAHPVALHAARAMRSALGRVIAVVREHATPESARLRELLLDAGCELVDAPASGATEGMGISIARAVAASPDASGWVIGLADMPAVQAQTIALVRDAIVAGHASAAP